ncbi:uncharacterized protein LOC119338765 [Triticum dicoccoides]|uniref:uncharacterized protein LOC119338765 n=1 Tax=Triticum dicoccoides TaxID=85692 RepID=UPI0018919B69|nr:uncharacterized protein LOC119338765 [Triticum dicoccoides]
MAQNGTADIEETPGNGNDQSQTASAPEPDKGLAKTSGGVMLELRMGENEFKKKMAPASSPEPPESEGIIQLRRAHYLVLLLATVAATITYQAGMNPPGGFWPDDHDGHKGGDPVLVTTHPRRYRAFFYCNSAALVASVLVIIMVQSKHLTSSAVHKSHGLEAAMILDLLSLMAAYAVGCARDVSTSLHVGALAGAVLVYVVIHIALFTLDHKGDSRGDDKEEEKMLKRRKVLLLLAILAATITYQAGLTPPGGFWVDEDVPGGHTAGYPVLSTGYPRRYATFFYCNAASFMSSIAVIILLVNPNLYRLGIRCYALYVCAVAGLFGLMAAYAAGSSRHLRTSIFMISLVAVVVTFIILLLLAFNFKFNKGLGLGSAHETKETPKGKEGNKKRYTKRKYLMLVGILVASVTYQAGLTPPGGVWPDGSDGHAAGNPVLRDSNKQRYRLFFYSNSVSFLASIVVILLLLLDETLFDTKQELESDDLHLLWVAQSSILLALLGLLWAYASGCSREWKTSGYVVALAVAVLLYMAIHVALSCHDKKGKKTPQQDGKSPGKQCSSEDGEGKLERVQSEINTV